LEFGDGGGVVSLVEIGGEGGGLWVYWNVEMVGVVSLVEIGGDGEGLWVYWKLEMVGVVSLVEIGGDGEGLSSVEIGDDEGLWV
jgi:hypothetical protein